jgi:hypothetical protein
MIGLSLRPLVEATDAAIALLHLRPRIEDVGVAVLEQIAQAVHCDWGAYWVLDPLSQRLQAIATWNALGEDGEHFEQDTRVRTLAPHAGNAWHVWRTRRPIWAADLMLEMCLPRSLGASRAGLRGGVWFGVQTDTTVYGVIELLARVMPQRRYETLIAFERAGTRLGYALEELRAAASHVH